MPRRHGRLLKFHTFTSYLLLLPTLKYIDTVGGTNTNIGLMCSKGREKFYKDFGSIERTDEKFGAGMIMISGSSVKVKLSLS